MHKAMRCYSENSLMDELFDELDPCCQKEIESKRQASAIAAKLRRFDPSNKRINITNSIFQNHNCCVGCYKEDDSRIEHDYFLLSQARQISESNNDLVDDSDFSGDDEDLLEYVSLSEEKRREDLKERLILAKEPKSRGFGAHLADSISHLDICLKADASLAHIDRKRCTIVHICDEQSMYCAWLDLYLDSLAKLYLGTRFRRLPVQHGGTIDWTKKWISNLSSFSSTKSFSKSPSFSLGGYILCFTDGVLCGWTDEKFGDDSGIRQNDIFTFLDRLHALQQQAPVFQPDADSASIDLEFGNQLRNTFDETEPSEEIEGSSFCGDSRCGKMFPHEHIGAAAASSGPSFLLAGTCGKEGQDAFPDNFFTRL